MSAVDHDFILTLSCPDRAGIVAAVTHDLAAHGVKLIGATAHYVNSDLDEGPIIEQAVERGDHTMTVDQLRTHAGFAMRTKPHAREPGEPSHPVQVVLYGGLFENGRGQRQTILDEIPPQLALV